LQSQLQSFERQGLRAAALTYDSPAILADFARRKSITYPLLADPQSQVIRAFGILNQSVPKGSLFDGIPHPGTFLIDASGIVLAKYFEQDYTDRYTAANILAQQFGSATAADPQVSSTSHLNLRSWAVDSLVHAGSRTRLVLEVALKPRMHVYAPGVQGYIPISWDLEPSPALKLHPVTYPDSRLLHLPAINETVPVYEGRFRITRDITIALPKSYKPVLSDAGELTVKGAFKYQACDDRQCYLPVTVPLTWRFKIEELDSQRAPKQLQRQ
jgi:hypothetical protein